MKIKYQHVSIHCRINGVEFFITASLPHYTYNPKKLPRLTLESREERKFNFEIVEDTLKSVIKTFEDSL